METEDPEGPATCTRHQGGGVVLVPAGGTLPTSVWGRNWAKNRGPGKPGGGIEIRAGSRTQGRQAGGHYLLQGVPLRRHRPARPGPGPLGAGSGSRVAGKAPRAPQTNRGNQWPGRSQWNVAWCVLRRGRGPELPGPPGPSLAPQSPPPAPHGPRCRHLAPRSQEAPGTPPQGTPGAAVRHTPDQKLLLSEDLGGSQIHGLRQAA